METDLERIGMQINQKQREEYLKEQRQKQLLSNQRYGKLKGM